MDTNIKIIEGVKQFPCLYDNCGDLDERNHAWMQLAEKMNMHVQGLQVRWHALYHMYQRDGNFKYADRMHFIYRNKERKMSTDNWPEFVVTDEYIKELNNEEQAQFVYLDAVEEVNHKSIKSSKESDCILPEVTQKKEKVHVKDLDVEGNGCSDVKIISKEEKFAYDSSQKLDDGIEIVVPSKPKEGDISNSTTSSGDDKMSTLYDLNKVNISFVDTKERSFEKPKSSVTERCEDVIFGELVSAMLKRMEESKKKNIKKEIMNLLFS